MTRRPNLILFGVDTLRSDHLSAYGYPRLTSPRIDRLARDGAVFLNHFSPSIPTTPGYASMLTGHDCFGTGVVALRHQGDLAEGRVTLPELLRLHGYTSTCVGFQSNPAARGFDRYIDYESWHPDPGTGRAAKAESLNAAVWGELDRLIQGGDPFFLFLRHMDPHSPYLPPTPFDRLFYDGDERDPNNRSLDPVLAFRPFADFFRSWFPSGVTDSRYIDAQYDGAIAYLDVAIGVLLNALMTRGILDDSVVVLASDHGETLYEHECFYDHHGLYDSNLRVPFIVRYPAAVPAGFRYTGTTEIQDVMPTVLDLLGIPAPDLGFTGQNLAPAWRGQTLTHRDELYLTEATWMRKQGWRTPEWKLIRALEPDFHFKPPVELYDLAHDPGETENLAEQRPDMVAQLTDRMEAWVSRRVEETGRPSPIEGATRWHGLDRGPFESSQEAYDTLHIGSIAGAQRIQDRARDEEENAP